MMILGNRKQCGTCKFFKQFKYYDYKDLITSKLNDDCKRCTAFKKEKTNKGKTFMKFNNDKEPLNIFKK